MRPRGGPDAAGRRDGHGGLHVSRAGAGVGRRPAIGPLLVRCAVLRTAQWHPPVPARDDGARRLGRSCTRRPRRSRASRRRFPAPWRESSAGVSRSGGRSASRERTTWGWRSRRSWPRPRGQPSSRRWRRLSPYPGLSSFKEKDAAQFFGREAEVQAAPLLAVIGPSGAGKTSFIRAGVIPAAPAGGAVCGSRPATGRSRPWRGPSCRSWRTSRRRCSGWWGRRRPTTRWRRSGCGAAVTARRCWWWTSSRSCSRSARPTNRRVLRPSSAGSPARPACTSCCRCATTS